MADNRYHYCVLYVRTLKQWEVTEAIKQALPEGRGIVFYPCAELWWRGEEKTVIRALFPGYVFIRSDMDPGELHELIRRRRRDVISFVKELRIGEKIIAGEQGYSEDNPEVAGEFTDLSGDEAEFLDFMLGFRYKDTDGSRKKVSDVGVIGMSYGYREAGKFVVMEGPLKGHENRIKGVKLRDRKAYLDVSVNGHAIKVGLEIRGKKYWFPDDKNAPELLEDGTEIDPAGMASRMMGNTMNMGKRRNKSYRGRG